MRLLIAILTALSFAASSTLSAMPLVWCIGSDGHRAIETILHQQVMQAPDPSAEEGIADGAHKDPCSDWQLLSAAGPPLAKTVDAAPKVVTAMMAYPPLKLVVGTSSPPHGARQVGSSLPRAAAHLFARRSVVLLI